MSQTPPLGGRCPAWITPCEGNPAPAAPARPAQARSAAAARGAERHSAPRGPDAQVARIHCRRRPSARLRPGVPAASLAPATDRLPSASTPAQRSLPPEHTLHPVQAPRPAPQPLVGDHHGGDQQRMQHQGALPISAPEPGGDSAGGQVHPHFPRGRQRHYWGECCLHPEEIRGGGRDASIFSPSRLSPLRLPFCSSGSGLLTLHPPQPLLSPLHQDGWVWPA